MMRMLPLGPVLNEASDISAPQPPGVSFRTGPFDWSISFCPFHFVHFIFEFIPTMSAPTGRVLPPVLVVRAREAVRALLVLSWLELGAAEDRSIVLDLQQGE